jgi:putative toxin-antitoxin system antitoxin component (TIGR02293 family)
MAASDPFRSEGATMAVRRSKDTPVHGPGAVEGQGIQVFAGRAWSPSYRALKSGFDASLVRTLEGKGTLRPEDVRLIIADRTLERRIAQGERLKIDEADGLLRLLRVRDHAVRVFDKTDLAEEWLRSPNPELEGEIPMAMAATDLGAREVEAVLTRIEHGVFG